MLVRPIYGQVDSPLPRRLVAPRREVALRKARRTDYLLVRRRKKGRRGCSSSGSAGKAAGKQTPKNLLRRVGGEDGRRFSVMVMKEGRGCQFTETWVSLDSDPDGSHDGNCKCPKQGGTI